MELYFKIISEKNVNDNNLVKIFSFNNRAVFVNIKNASFFIKLSDKKSIYLFGDFFYHIKNNDDIKIVDEKSSNYLKNLFSTNSLDNIISNLEGQYIGILIDNEKNNIKIFSDRYARVDTFYHLDKSKFYLATDLNFIFNQLKPEYDQKMLAHVFSAYGYYTPKGFTIYKNVKQLKVGEIITVSNLDISSEIIKFKPSEIKDYNDSYLEKYYKFFKESIISRANRNGINWISSSSGWDSSSITGMLIDELGSRKVKMLFGSMEYSKETAMINKYECDKIKKIGKYFDIKPEMVKLDFKNKNAAGYWEKVLPYYKSKHIYSYTTFNFTKISDGIKLKNNGMQYVFNGETSDSFHNFGFSQFATFFHTKKSFTEYADKMNCFLYGPSFFKKVTDRNFEKDKIYQIFKKMNEKIEFETSWKNKKEMIQSYLFPFFYGAPRIPFARTYKNPLFNNIGEEMIYKFAFTEYIPEVLNSLSEKNLYSWLIYLYQSFHSQGSTVAVQKHSMEMNNHKWRMPFNDIRLINLLSSAPEKWGRGVEINNTKYPLKWVLKNKIKFPYEILEEGPHSYLYDVIEGFSLLSEITYHSGVTDFFKEKIKNKPYKEIITDEYFNINYLDELVNSFLDGKEVQGKDLNNLVTLLTLTTTGWY